jgi:hypothetical protein
MTKSFKMVVLLAMLNTNTLPGAIGVDDLCREIRKFVSRSAALKADFAVPFEDLRQLRSYIKNNLINAWIGGRGTGDRVFFEYADDELSTTFGVAPGLNKFAEMARELVDWRLAEYLDRQSPETVDIGDGKPTPTKALSSGESYMRADIPRAVGLEFRPSNWNQGYVFEDDQIFLLVTLNKQGMADEHQYGDRFLSIGKFEWVSQNKQSQTGKAGRTIQAEGIPIHLFVRKTKKIGNKAAPFVYCGGVEFESWEGNNPITVRWRLKEPLSGSLAELFGVEW